MAIKVKPTVVIGYVGSVLDSGFHAERWTKWRPTVSLAGHGDLPIARFELIHQPAHVDIARCVAADIERKSPTSSVRLTEQSLDNPWDFEEVYSSLQDFADALAFKPEAEDYLIHITTGTHVQQICLFLMTESRQFPGRLLQSSPADPKNRSAEGRYSIIDLDLSKYDRLAARRRRRATEGALFLKAGIETRNESFNRLIDQIEHVVIHSCEPILLMGPTGAGKTQLARRIFQLKQLRRQVVGSFVEVNCATLRGDAAMSTLFGHVKGAFTGALKDRAGLLRSASGGLLFLDEVGELGLDEQAMLLRALEEKRFLPLGSDQEVTSEFQLIAGTNRDLTAAVGHGRFREDLLARMNLWTFRLPGLSQRPEDIEPNLDFELDQVSKRILRQVTMNREARGLFLQFARSPVARWSGNFRDLGAAVSRMATMSSDGRINEQVVTAEINRLETNWDLLVDEKGAQGSVASSVLGVDEFNRLDLFDQAQLSFVIGICRQSPTLSEAGRQLFGVSREQRKTTNDADRLRKYLARFGLQWESVFSDNTHFKPTTRVARQPRAHGG